MGKKAAIMLIAMIVCIIPLAAGAAYADELPIRVVINGERVNWSNPNEVFIANEKVYGPSSYFTDYLNASVKIDEQNSRIEIAIGQAKTVLPVYDLDQLTNAAAISAISLNGSVHLPLIDTGNELGLSARWDASVQTVYIRGDQIKPSESPKAVSPKAKDAPAFVVNEKPVGMKPQPYKAGDNVYVPIRVIAYALGIEVTQDAMDSISLRYGNASETITNPVTRFETPYVDLGFLEKRLGVAVHYDDQSHTYQLTTQTPAQSIQDIISNEQQLVIEDMYGFVVSYNDRISQVFNKYKDSRLMLSKGPYDDSGNSYAQLSLSISFNVGADVPVQFGEVEEILGQRVESSAVNAVMQYVKTRTDRDTQLPQKTFEDRHYKIYVSGDRSGTGVTVFKKTIPGKIALEDVHGFQISYDRSSRLTKAGVQVMKGPFYPQGEDPDNRILILGIGYDENARHAQQYEEVKGILLQKLSAKVYASIHQQARVILNNQAKGIATAPAELTDGHYTIIVQGAPAAQGVEITVITEPISIVLDGIVLEVAESQPFLENGSVYVPLRLISESLGASVNFQEEARMIAITKGDKKVTLALDGEVNGARVIVQNQRTFVPLRFISESLGSEVKWEGAAKTVYIDTNKD
ncbi:hypothetical protein DUZ99_18415 [Xylanibacillus composti]|uniref:Copper amine oxidase-like N-terminal domain-containing protein n=1 Tax=Xylanibacillus composti TaxID=1572762 RepID=A0A8J4M3G7_9BACL|nr:stalk domain-containing protein [Xylanibacillus composti]MDT9726944.1 hypothetical protein [Xylanibacillus composti]GIQ70085.1 hypothetical protein XYCOK13_29090 [Xylanibacillus composti]